ncbi:MAG: OmpH family outer membrane protein [Firmicutes bacterium]|nr:OmpH family outer membrane protein [Bacillota bacterium]
MRLKGTKKIVPMVLVMGLVFAITGLVTANGGSTVGYVDMQRLQKELSLFQDFQELLQQKNAEYNSFGTYLQTQQNNELSALEKQKEAEIKGKSEAERKEIEAKYQEQALKLIKSYQQKLEAENARLSGEVQAKHDEILARIEKTLEEIAKKEGYAIILEKTVVYKGGADLTEQVIAALQQ